MPDLAEEQLHEEFARFRAEFQEELRPPGVEVARRLVARRRRVRTAVTACGVILALVGGLSAYRHHDGRSAAGLDALAALHQAMNLVDVRPSSPEVSRPGVWFGTIRGAPVGHTFGYEYPPHPGGGGQYPVGEYMLTFACVGPGTMTVAYRAENVDDTMGKPCGGDVVGVGLHLSTPDVISVSVTGDAAAVAAGTQFAIALTDPRGVEADAALPTDPGDELIWDSVGSTYDPQIYSTMVTVAGTYRLSLACVGTGAVQVTLVLGGAQASQPVTCDWSGGHVDLELSTDAETQLSVQLGGSADAGLAYRVVRLA